MLIMNITRAADYAIWILVALSSKEGVVSSKELAEEINVPFNHLSKVVQLLSRRGYIRSRKGKGGGIVLAKNPKQIDLAEVVEAIEGPLVLSECLFNRKSCRLSGKCKFHKCLGALQSQMRKFLASRTIFDLLPA